MATITRYVNTASTAGGDGTTNATAGANRAYATLSEWEAAEQTDLDTANNIMDCICEGSAADTTATTVDGWTTSATDYIQIRTAAAGRSATGIWDAGAYRLDCVDSCFAVRESYLKITGIQAKSTRSVSNYPRIFAFSSITGSSDIYVDKCILVSNLTGGNARRGINCQDADLTLTITNSTIEDLLGNTRNLSVETGGTVNFYNSISTGGNSGVYRAAGTVNVTNCAVFNNGTDFNGTITATYSASDDNPAGTGNVDISPGGTEATDWASAFTDYANGDFSVKDSSSVLYNAGTDLSGSGVTDDIIGTARPQVTTYDIGAFELVAAGGVNAPTGNIRGCLYGPMGGVI